MEIKEVFFVRVQNRSSSEIAEVLKTQILPGTTYWTDKWRAYRRADQSNLGAAHLTVNHSIEFITEEKVNTNMVEGFWAVFKNRMNKQGYKRAKSENLLEYIGEFFFKRNLKDDLRDFGRIIKSYLSNY